MNWTPVSSSNLKAVAYDASLYIQFHNGGTYVYYDALKDVYDELMAASSHSSYFAHEI